MKIPYVILLMYLAVEAGCDWKRKEVSTKRWILMMMILPIASFFMPDYHYSLTGMAPGIGLILLSIVTRGAVGLGDGMVLMVCGCILDIEAGTALFMTALLLTMPIALWKLIIQKKERSEELAFVPFLLAAYLIVLLNS